MTPQELKAAEQELLFNRGCVEHMRQETERLNILIDQRKKELTEHYLEKLNQLKLTAQEVEEGLVAARLRS